MSKAKKKAQAVKSVADFAMRQFDSLSVPEKIALLNSLAVALTGDEAMLAGSMAFNLERLEANQLKFRAVIGKKPKQPTQGKAKQ